ncbi:MAG: protein-L-isoaspartate(D-aspartate) O-methyltransferase, partial [Micromonosporaceae bacterium]|nr:protein-L-isoaspartate(D-aspartate) O-methyltransferase [Micromonosporaceae bacterium]
MDDDAWPQVLIEFATRDIAERVAVDRLRPELATAQAAGVLDGWWFIRKSPCWRLRCQPTSNHTAHPLAPVLEVLTAEGRIVGWTAGIYEPEVFAFGGPAGMQVAHELFHLDSRNILDHLARQQAQPDTSGLGRRELVILLCSVLMRGAGLDWYEQGDVWARVAQQRKADRIMPTSRRLRSDVHRLMTVDVNPAGRLVDGGPLAAIADWCTAFERTGQQLADLVRRGRLERGLRAVLAHHVIFHWNRLGVPPMDQTILSTLAKEVVMGISDTAASAPDAGDGGTNLGGVNTTVTNQARTPAERLRNELADDLRDRGTVRTQRVDEAVRAVPRHLFLPGVALEEAYADHPVYTKYDSTGASISAASQPTIVAMMLEQLQAEPGHRVLELGAGTGYHAGLLAHLVGEGGQVTTIDVDEDTVDGARSGLAAAGFANV